MSSKTILLLAVIALVLLSAGVFVLAAKFDFDSLFEAYLATLLADVVIGLGIVAYLQQWWTRHERRRTMLGLIRNEMDFNEGVWAKWKEGLEHEAVPIYLFRTAAWDACRDIYEMVGLESAHAIGEVYDSIKALHFLAEALLRLHTTGGLQLVVVQKTRDDLFGVILSRGTQELEDQLEKAKKEIDRLLGQATR